MHKRKRVRSLKILTVLGAMIVAMAITVTAQAQQGDQTESANTSASITGGGAAPHVECLWVLPDMRSGEGTNTVEYIPANLNDVHDDDPAAFPDRDPAAAGDQEPCWAPLDAAGNATAKPEQPDDPNGDMGPLVTVRPNLHDQPEERSIQLWSAVDHQNGISNISDVYWRIFHPAGDLKIQVHGTKVDVTDCGNLGMSSGPVSAGMNGMFEAAHHTGQLQSETIDDPNKGMIALCQQEVKSIWFSQFELSKDQPCGTYRVEVTAVANSGATEKKNATIDVPCIFYMELDFTTVDWGTISPGSTQVVGGDLIWDDPAANAPTVRNIGNDGMGLMIEFSELVGLNEGKIIDLFDAKYGRSAGTLLSIDPIPANTPTDFGTAHAQVLCANELGKLDLSVHPEFGLPVDTYTGQVRLTGYHVPDMCAGNQHLP